MLMAIGCSETDREQQDDNENDNDIVIAHRGSTYWAPEESEAALSWARNIGADYLEFDLQMTSDGVLIALHDDNLTRTTDIAQKFPTRKDNSVNSFTYEELLTLDIGSWFCDTDALGTERARESFRGLDVMSLEDVVMIASGYRVKRESYPNGKRITHTEDGKIVTTYEIDPNDNGNRPGIYPETKEPHLFPGIEAALKSELTRLGWYAEDATSLVELATQSDRVAIANTPQRVIVQTFSKTSLQNLNEIFADYVPLCFLLWLDPDDISGESMQSEDEYRDWVLFGKQNGATIIGPSIGGEPNNYNDLLKAEMSTIIKEQGLQTHAYSFDTNEQMTEYSPKENNLVDGWFTNRAELTLDYIQTSGIRSCSTPLLDPSEVLDDLGY